ncbi:MAG: IS1380 family transposase [Alphaproteobacteria bacterium]|nr:IS1380 family transposase [Alphaproteobacteria bacterium]
MSLSSRKLDRLQATFDHGGIVANAGLVVPATLMVRLGLESLIDGWVKTGSARPGRKILTLVAAMIAGATHIDHVDILRAGATQRVLPFTVMAPSTIGSFLRSFTFGHIRQLDAVLSRTLGRAWAAGAGPGDGPLIVDLDSTICEVHGKQKQAAGYGYTRRLGYHPLLATRAGTGEVLLARMRRGSANTARGVVRFVDELVANLARAGASGPMTVRADSGFWSWKLCDRLDTHGVAWSITVRLHTKMKAAIAAIDETAWHDIDYTIGGQAQVAETTYTAGKGKKKRTVRLIVRRTRLVEPAQRRLWPDWRHHAFITSDHEIDAVDADRFHREHAVVELAIRDLKEGAGLDHIPSGHYHANAAWLACAVLAHNLGAWTTQLAGQPPVTNRTRRTRLIQVPAVTVNRSGRTLLRLPTRWPWAHAFTNTLNALRALPAPSG